MKKIIFVLISALAVVSCGYDSKPADPGDGSKVIEITSPRLAVEGKKIFVYYLRDGVPVRSLMKENISLEPPVTVDPQKWDSYGETLESILIASDSVGLYDFTGTEHHSNYVQSPDGGLLFFTAWNSTTCKRDLYWIRKTGGFPVQITSDDWWADFSVPFAFIEDRGNKFVDGSKSWVLLCLSSNPVSPPEIVALWMDGRRQYLVLSHDNDIYKENHVKGLWQQKGEVRTSAGNTVHYYELSSSRKESGKETLYYAGGGKNPAAWNEEAVLKAIDGGRAFSISTLELKHSNDEQEVLEQLLPGFMDSK